MKATHFYTYVGHGTMTKNKLQSDFDQYLKSIEGVLITSNQLNDFKKQIKDKSVELNAKYPRCTPLVISFSELYTNNGFMIGGFYYLTFQLLAANLTDITK